MLTAVRRARTFSTHDPAPEPDAIMYIPRSHAESRPDELYAYIEAHPLATLVTSSPGHGLFATHLPLVLHRDRGTHGTLEGHIARANPHHEHMRAMSASDEALVIVSGPDAYITPDWYASRREHGRVVPTWNYVAVHVYATMHVTDDPAFLRRHLEALVPKHEAARDGSWSIAAAPADYIEQQLRAIVGIELAITRIEGKWKMSQNRPAADVEGVIDGLRSSSDPQDRAVAEIVSTRYHERDGEG
jgi:transcriptional regulator